MIAFVGKALLAAIKLTPIVVSGSLALTPAAPSQTVAVSCPHHGRLTELYYSATNSARISNVHVIGRRELELDGALVAGYPWGTVSYRLTCEG